MGTENRGEELGERRGEKGEGTYYSPSTINAQNKLMLLF